MVVVLIVPLATALLCYWLRALRAVYLASIAGSVVLAAVSAGPIVTSLSAALSGLGGVLFMDALSGYIMALVISLSLAASLYSAWYMEHEFREGLVDLGGVRLYFGLFHLFVFTMVLVTVSDNLAVMWIAIEATTIVSAALIGLGYKKRGQAVEAAWKYIILCTVGITFALLGTFIVYYASAVAIGGAGSLNWTALRDMAPGLNPGTMKLAFLFVLVGYGTKAGLAPVHNWLPDAHSEAPSPISALLSGMLLNTAFYGIMRFVALVSPSAGAAFTGNLLMVFGLISIGLAAVFILVQSNFKRLLAYSSIEHMGIISLGVGIGGFTGLFGSLLHMLNHALSKPLMFFVSGKLQARYASTRIDEVGGVLTAMPFLGGLAFIGALSLAGTPPFNIFISEFTVIKAAVDRGLWPVVVLFLVFVAVVFYGMLSGFARILFGRPNGREAPAMEAQGGRGRALGMLVNIMLAAMAALIITLGLHVPGVIDRAIRSCIAAMGVS
jgi:hydrogenase-4 component F